MERDVRTLINVKGLGMFQRFLILLAGRTGQVINYTSLGNDIGLSATAVKNWISVLKASFIIFELQPFFENINKRVIKSDLKQAPAEAISQNAITKPATITTSLLKNVFDSLIIPIS